MVDLSEVVTNLQHERYRKSVPTRLERITATASARKAYYVVRPFLPVGIRKHLQRIRLSGRELLMSGPQVTSGYWRNDEATARSYVRPAGRNTVFYRTGDRVRRPLGEGPLTFIGRTDDQVKVLGYRVELGEVEAKLREEPGIASAAAVAWPLTSTGAGGVVAFVTGADIDSAVVRANLQARLPSYAVPRAIHVLTELPQNVNGKVDRHALLRLLGDARSEC